MKTGFTGTKNHPRERLFPQAIRTPWSRAGRGIMDGMKPVTHAELAKILDGITEHTGATYGWLEAAKRPPYDWPKDEPFPVDETKLTRMRELAAELSRLAKEFYTEAYETRKAQTAARPPEPAWTVVYRYRDPDSDEEEYEGEPQPSRHLALYDVGWWTARGRGDTPLRLIGPDGAVELEGQALIDAGLAALHQE